MPFTNRPLSTVRLSAVPLTVFALALAVVLFSWYQARAAVAAEEEERFNAEADRLRDSIRDRLSAYITMLRTGSALFSSTSTVNEEQFRVFTRGLNLPKGIQGIGYSARVPPSRAYALVSARRRDGLPEFRIWPEYPRDEYHTILYLEPLNDRNRAAIGYDMFTDPTRGAAMERARDRGEPVTSGRVILKQEITEEQQAGFLIYMPVYEGGVPATEAERRARLIGFVYSPFRSRDLFTDIYGDSPRALVRFAVYGGEPSPEQLLYSSLEGGERGRRAAPREFELAGQKWTLSVVSTPVLDRLSSAGVLPVMLWAGIAVSIVLAALTALQTRARLRAERSESIAADASRQFRQLANWIPQLAWMARRDGGIYWYNERWYEYTGLERQDAAAHGWKSVIEPRHLPAVLDAWQDSLQTGEPFETEIPLRGRDGQYRLFLTRAAPFRDDTGRIVHWFGTNTDVQYQHDATRALQEQADTLEIVNRTGTQLAAELDLDTLAQAITDAGTRLTRAQIGAFIYRPPDTGGARFRVYALSGFLGERTGAGGSADGDPLFGPSFRGDSVIRSDDITQDPRYEGDVEAARVRVRSYLCVPVKSRWGDVLGGLCFGHGEPGIFTDRDERIILGIAAQAAIAIDNARLYGQVHQLLDSERAARAEAERVSRMKDEFLATLSHELRTPMNAVVGWAHVLNTGSLSGDKRANAVQTILRNARAQSKLIEDLLDMSAIISGRVRVDAALVDLQDVATSAIDIVRPTADAKGVHLQFEPGDGPYPVTGDPNRLQQVVWNLLTNAIKFTPTGGRVTLALARRDTRVELVVADTGIGIDPDFLPFAFDRFRQADASFTRGYGGLGLGLSIVRSLVEMHAGTVTAESRGRGEGASFTILLPLAHAEASVRLRPDARRPAAVHADVLRNVVVLIVDDDEDAMTLTQEVLRQHGARTLAARSGPDALQILNDCDEPIGLVVSDIGMPVMDGFELIRRIRQLPAQCGGQAPAVALTAYAGSEDRGRAVAAGFNLHLTKPFTPDELIAACTLLLTYRFKDRRGTTRPATGAYESGSSSVSQ